MDILSPVLIVGGLGHLGRHIATQLVKEYPGCRVEALDKQEAKDQDLRIFARIHQCDITNATQVERAVRLCSPTVVIHTASPRAFLHDLDFCMKINYDGTGHLLDAAAAVGSVKAFIYTSSSSVVHDSFSDLIDVDESAPVLYMPQQAEAYHHSKAKAETLVLQSNGRNGVRTASLRPSGLFGPNDEDDQTTARILKSATEGKLRVQLGDNSNLVDWTWIDNAAKAHILAAEALIKEGTTDAGAHEGKVAGEAFFITNDEPLPFWDFARGLGAAAGHPVAASSITVIPQWLGYPMGFLAEWVVWMTSFGRKTATFNRKVLKYSCIARTFDISKAKTRLGYNPRAAVPLHEAFQLATAPYRNSHTSATRATFASAASK